MGVETTPEVPICAPELEGWTGLLSRRSACPIGTNLRPLSARGNGTPLKLGTPTSEAGVLQVWNWYGERPV